MWYALRERLAAGMGDLELPSTQFSSTSTSAPLFFSIYTSSSIAILTCAGPGARDALVQEAAASAYVTDLSSSSVVGLIVVCVYVCMYVCVHRLSDLIVESLHCFTHTHTRIRHSLSFPLPVG